MSYDQRIFSVIHAFEQTGLAHTCDLGFLNKHILTIEKNDIDAAVARMVWADWIRTRTNGRVTFYATTSTGRNEMRQQK